MKEWLLGVGCISFAVGVLADSLLMALIVAPALIIGICLIKEAEL